MPRRPPVPPSSSDSAGSAHCSSSGTRSRAGRTISALAGTATIAAHGTATGTATGTANGPPTVVGPRNDSTTGNGTSSTWSGTSPTSTHSSCTGSCARSTDDEGFTADADGVDAHRWLHATYAVAARDGTPGAHRAYMRALDRVMRLVRPLVAS